MAGNVRTTLADVETETGTSLAAIAAELNEREIETPRGGRWYLASVARLKARLGRLQAG